MTLRLISLVNRGTERIRRDLRRFSGFDTLTNLPIKRVKALKRLGSTYGGWVIPHSTIHPGAICYCAGAGEDITFDLALANDFACEVFTFDPTPRAISHVQRVAKFCKRLTFRAIGLWDSEQVLKFYAPLDPSHVSHSALNLQRTDTWFEAPCRPVADIMRELGHAKIDLLKLDVEGAEYRVLDSILENGIYPTVLCVEFDEAYNPLDSNFKNRIRIAAAKLRDSGYELVAARGRANYTFLRSPA